MTLKLDFPRIVTLELSSRCNLKCPYCSVHELKYSRNKPFMDTALIHRLIKECSNHNATLWLNYMGEPLLHKKFSIILTWIKKFKVEASIESNATLWNKNNWSEQLANSPLKKIIVTLEPTSALFDTHRKGGDFKEVVNSLKNFISSRKGDFPLLEIQMILTKHNANLKEEFKQLGVFIGVDRAFYKPIMIHQFTNNKEYHNTIIDNYWSNDIPGRYTQNDNGDISLSSSILNTPCPKLDEAVILSDGSLAMCCYDKGGDYCYGNVSNQTLASAWKEGKNFRKDTMYNRKTPYCAYCLEDNIENYFWD